MWPVLLVLTVAAALVTSAFAWFWAWLIGTGLVTADRSRRTEGTARDIRTW